MRNKYNQLRGREVESVTTTSNSKDSSNNDAFKFQSLSSSDNGWKKGGY